MGKNGYPRLLSGRAIPAQRFFFGENFKRNAARSRFVRVKKQIGGNNVLHKKIKVWGQTQKARVAGWLMDVGKIEVL